MPEPGQTVFTHTLPQLTDLLRGARITRAYAGPHEGHTVLMIETDATGSVQGTILALTITGFFKLSVDEINVCVLKAAPEGACPLPI